MLAEILAHAGGSSGDFITPSWRAPCTIGRNGLAGRGAKREGDLKTPLGLLPLREVLYRPDRLSAPVTQLPVRALSPEDGWCDAPGDPAYNQPVTMPFRASAETLWRDDHVYDVIVTLGWNDAPPRPGLGSAIFLHVMRPDRAGTEGCVALELRHLLAFLESAKPGGALHVRAREQAG